MRVDTGKIRNRRVLRFHQLDDILAEVGRLSATPTRPRGNWSLGQICQHLAVAINLSIDGAPPDAPFTAPIWLRILGRVIKRRMLTKGMSAGFKLPADAPPSLQPGETDATAASASLRAAIGRLAREAHRAPHPVFGPMSRADWDQLHMRHAEMHLSFIQPEKGLPPPSEKFAVAKRWTADRLIHLSFCVICGIFRKVLAIPRRQDGFWLPRRRAGR